MKFFPLFMSFCTYGNLLASDDTLLIKTYYSDKKIFEVFQTTSPDSTPDGNYKSYTTYGKILSEGRFKAGEKVGIWVYYSDGALATETVQKYDYDSQTELYFNYTYEERYGVPRFPGGSIEFQRYLLKKLSKRISPETNKKYLGKKTTIAFSIEPGM